MIRWMVWVPLFLWVSPFCLFINNINLSPLDIHATIEEKVRYKMTLLDVLIDNDAAHLEEVFSK